MKVLSLFDCWNIAFSSETCENIIKLELYESKLCNLYYSSIKLPNVTDFTFLSNEDEKTQYFFLFDLLSMAKMIRFTIGFRQFLCLNNSFNQKIEYLKIAFERDYFNFSDENKINYRFMQLNEMELLEKIFSLNNLK